MLTMCAFKRTGSSQALKPRDLRRCHHFVEFTPRWPWPPIYCATSSWIHDAACSLRRAIELQVGFFLAVRIADHFPAVAGQVAAMNDERRHRAVTRGFFKLVDPAAVVGQRLAGEEFWIVRGRLVDEEERTLPFRSTPL